MSPAIWAVIAAVVILDLFVMVRVFKRMRPMLALARLPDDSQRQALISATDALVTDQLGTHTGGDPARLSGALGGLLPRVRELWRSHGIELKPDELNVVIENTAVNRRVTSRKVIRAALSAIG